MHDSVYQLFLEEAQELLKILEAGLLVLRKQREASQVHELMRAAHTIKGGAAMMGLSAIAAIAHRLEDVFRGLYRQDIEVDEALENLLIRAYDCLETPILQDIETGKHDEAAALAAAEPILVQLEEKLRALGLEMDLEEVLPATTDFGLDMVNMLFSGDVADGLSQLRKLLPLPDTMARLEGVRSQIETFAGIGELTSLPGFTELAQTVLDALSLHPEHCQTIGYLALSAFESAQGTVLAGNPIQGGQFSEALRAWTQSQPPGTDLAATTPLVMADSEGSLAFTPYPTAQILEPSENLDRLDEDWDEATEEAMLLGLFGEEASAVSEDSSPWQVEDAPTQDGLPVPATTDLASDDILADLEQFLADSETALEVTERADPGPLDTGWADRTSGPETVEPVASSQAKASAAGVPLSLSPSAAPLSMSPAKPVHVQLDRLKRLNHLFGELVTQENKTVLQAQHLQNIIVSMTLRLRNFEQITRDVQAWADHEDVYTPVQEVTEEVAQLGEAIRDMTAIAQQGQIVHRQKQQTLHQIRMILTMAELLVFTISGRTLALSMDSVEAITSVEWDTIESHQGKPAFCWNGELVSLHSRNSLLKYYPPPGGNSKTLPTIPLPEDGKVSMVIVSNGSKRVALQVDAILQAQDLTIKPFGLAVQAPSYFCGCTTLGDGTMIPVIDGQALVVQSQNTQSEVSSEVEPVCPLPATKASSPFPSGVFPAHTLESDDDSTGGDGSLAEVTTILVVDDSLTARHVLVFTLEKAGYQTLQAKDGQEALSQLQKNFDAIQAIFCDVEMPRMNGFEFLSQCHQAYGETAPPVIMLTSRSGEKHRQMGTDLGARAYLTKPYLEQVLLNTLQACLEQSANPDSTMKTPASV